MLSILECVRAAPSADESFFVKSGCAFSRTCGKEDQKRAVPRIIFCESLVSDVESPFLGLADIEVANNHTLRNSEANVEKLRHSLPRKSIGTRSGSQ